jgi:prepilin-type N-terminal cleavage/methylation domain-containing protein
MDLPLLIPLFAKDTAMLRRARGITLIEILIVISIIGLLVALTLPAIQGARESARLTECKNNLRQIGLAVTIHHDTHGYYPSGGWAFCWVGDPERGRGKEQPGSWAFSILDYIEQSSIWQMVEGKTGMAKSEAIVKINATPVGIFTCVTRREPMALPIDKVEPGLKTNDTNKLPILFGYRGDYAINTGDFGTAEPPEPFPKNIEELESPDVKWYETDEYTGISFGKSEVKMAEVTDGASKTYMVGEKTINPINYLTGADYGDNDTVYSGFDEDNGRSAAQTPQRDGPRSRVTSFGSAHPSVWNVVFCDGSVQSMSYTINAETHKRLANRSDGNTPEVSDIK